MGKIIQNTFNGGLNQDISDLLRQSNTLRGAKNIRIIDLDSSTYAVTLVDGTEDAFTLTAGYIPIASREYNNTLYIISIEPGGTVEIGSYPSPDYAIPASGDFNVYRPFNNLENGPFRTAEFGYIEDDFLDLVIQPEYDNSVNVIIVSKGHNMRIINSKFERIPPADYQELADRIGDANSNTYTTTSLDKETSLILTSDKILKIDYNSIEDGGQLTYGNYVYLFEYMTEDFNATDVVGQSGLCSVFSGTTDNDVKGGFQNDQANKLVKLQLSNVDTDFKYFRVHFKYSSGTRDAEHNAVFEMTTPIPITGTSMTFIHSGFEETIEVEESVINLDVSIIDSASTGEAVGGYLMLGDIVEREYDYTEFKEFAATVTMDYSTREFSSTVGIYTDPENIYRYMGHFGGETYPYAMIFVLPDGKLTPPFPVEGKDTVSNNTINDKGLFRFRNSNEIAGVVMNDVHSGNTLNVKYVEFYVGADPIKLAAIKEVSLGFFFVRGDRKPDLITQGILIPTLRVPPLSSLCFGNIPTCETYYRSTNEESDYRFIPCIDNLIEAYQRAGWDGEGSDYVVDDRNQILHGYMPIFINDIPEQYSQYGQDPAAPINNYSLKDWALITGDSLINNPEVVSQLNGRSGINIKQLGKIWSKVNGEITPVYRQGSTGFLPQAPDVNVGLFYTQTDFERYNDNSNLINNVISVPESTFASGSNFISKTEFSIFYRYSENGSDESQNFDASQNYNSYFGITLINDNLVNSGTKNVANPIAGNARRNYENVGTLPQFNHLLETSGVGRENLNQLVPASFLVNLYQGNQRTNTEILALYPTLDGVIYNQVGQRYEWDDLPTSNKISIYGGDCYISKVTRRLNQSGYPNPNTPFDRKNIHAGISISWWQESKYNLNLRIPFRFDANETTDRSFYPFEGSGNYETFRQYRLPETVEGNKGYSVTELPKTFIPISELAPFIKSSFFSRAHHSARHIPNAFANGYRIFEGLNFRDYDTAMGAIVMILNFRGDMVIIFEHGIGVTSIEQRIQTGEDFAGGIFVEPSGILPPTLSFFSRDIGCQQPKSIIQTPSAIYGIDADKHKIWQIRENLMAITEDGLSSFMKKATFNNPRSGYDFEFNEVIFTTDDWTLCFREGLEKFTSFYTMKPSHYATRSDEFYSFHNSKFNRHNANTKTIYGNIEDSYIEFTINEGVGSAKTHDYINIISNEVEPIKIEFFTYSDRTYNDDVIELAKVQQYSKVEQEVDFFTEEDKIRYKDKKFVVQIPNAEIYNKKSVKDDWNKEGRMRNKYLVVRLTYNTEDYLHLIAILTSTRHSFS